MHSSHLMFFNATDLIWAWLFPIAYVLHIAEEYWGGDGFILHLSQTRGVHFSPMRFFVMTGIGLTLMILGIALAQKFKFPQLLLVIFGTVILINGLAHAISSIVTRRYNPGLMSGMLIWIPLGALTLAQLWGSMHTSRYLTAAGIGAAIQAVVSLVLTKDWIRPASWR